MCPIRSRNSHAYTMLVRSTEGVGGESTCRPSQRPLLGERFMEDQQIGWLAAIIIGGIAGWLAEQFMKSQMGLVMNIVLGIVGAEIASLLFSLLGVTFGGWSGYLIASFIAASILILVARMIRRPAY